MLNQTYRAALWIMRHHSLRTLDQHSTVLVEENRKLAVPRRADTECASGKVSLHREVLFMFIVLCFVLFARKNYG